MRIVITVIVCLCVCVSLKAQQLSIEKLPDWVSRHDPNYEASPSQNDVDGGSYYIDVESQMNADKKVVFTRQVYKIVSHAGIQDNSEVSVSYDPAYQRVAFHDIHILRDGQKINKLVLSKIKTIHQETELRRSIYNGSLTAVLFLEDVRVGDIIEYAYSVYGFNPVFNGKFATTLDLQFGEPVESIFYRIICPSSRPLAIKTSHTEIQPAISTSGANRVYEWKAAHVPPLKMQDMTPSWYDPYPTVMISEYKNWKEVNEWALGMFATNNTLSPALKTKIDAIRSSGGTVEERVVQALRFVQDDVRYLGIEMNVHSHKPHDPNKIFAQRFGDCKDKSLLLCIMLRNLGAEAWPVLISTDNKRMLAEKLPSPGVFDHATVRARINNKFYWFDPTLTYQRGNLENISYPDYQCGLVVSDTTTTLTTIPLQDRGQVVAKEEFMLKEVPGPATLTVTSTFTGPFAEDVRKELKNNSSAEMQKTYLNFYNQYYDEIKTRDSLKVVDDDSSNKLVTYEYYTINKMWDVKQQKNRASFYGLLFNDALKKPEDKNRTMPLRLRYPAHYTEEIYINLPETWGFEFEPEAVNSASYKFSSHGEYTDQTMHLTYKYTALKDFISEGDAKDYLTNYDKMATNTYDLTKSIKSEESPEVKNSASNMPARLVGYIVFLGVLVTGGIMRARRR